jgi:hypothetical protein
VEQDQGDEVQRFQDPTAYKPGDEVNGHVLGTDNVWHSMAAVPLSPASVMGPPLRYWGRYRKRWRKTYLVFAVLGPLSLLGMPGGASRYGLLDLLFAATVSAALVAAFVNLLVAIPTSASSRRLPMSSVPVRPDDPPAGRGGPLSVIRKPGRSKWALAAGLPFAVIAAAVVWAALVSGGGSRTPTPEESYLTAIRTAEPHSASTSDAVLLASGRTFCAVYAQQGADGVARALDGVERANGAETRRIMGVISLAATTHLCPQRHT